MVTRPFMIFLTAFLPDAFLEDLAETFLFGALFLDGFLAGAVLTGAFLAEAFLNFFAGAVTD